MWNILLPTAPRPVFEAAEAHLCINARHEGVGPSDSFLLPSYWAPYICHALGDFGQTMASLCLSPTPTPIPLSVAVR